ncbi:MAG: hypothetical protein JO345_09845 [Streptosporangiaceae bacterium]|nr:hypothetical protein [Streptosporangiaceae bacterium]
MTALAPVLAGCTVHPAATGSENPAAAGTGTAGHLGVPAYYVVLVGNPQHPPSGEPPGEAIEVRETATGRLTDDFPLTLRLHSHMYSPFGTLAVAADQRTFFVSYPEDFDFATQNAPVVTGIYRFRLSGAGRITGFAKVAQGSGYPDGQFAMMASPDGQKIAMVDPAAGAGAIAVAGLATGQRKVWTGRAPGVAGTPGCCALLSWEADNRTLVLTGGSGRAQRAGLTQDVRTLDTSGPGGSLAGSRHLVTLDLSGLPGDLAGAVLSPDGRTITALVVFAPNSHDEQPQGRDEIIEISAVTGQQTKVLFSQQSSSSIPSGSDFGAQIASDGHGHLLQGGLTGGGFSAAEYVVNWFDGRRFHPLPLDLGSASTLTDFAW